MCGIAGIYDVNGPGVDAGLLERMASSLAHRGPDGAGFILADTAAGRFTPLMAGLSGAASIKADLGLAHRRLSIIDLSEAGRQPMRSGSGSDWIVYNGEIYNYIELRDELRRRGRRFTTGTDTEVILSAYAEWGRECLARFNGMFAFALWDGREKTLFCARDRFGIKPFYYHHANGRFIFASEIKGIVSTGAAPFEPEARMIYDYLSLGLVDHTEDTFFKGVKKLLPAHYLTVSRDGIKTVRWWDLRPEDAAGRVPDDGLCAAEFYRIFEDSVRLRLRSDVPVGTCLSGGIDSSAVACTMNRLITSGPAGGALQADRRQKTFSACFDEPRYDERPYIDAVLKATGADGRRVFPDGARLFDELPRIIYHQDEPFRTTSIFAQWNVMRLAKEAGVKVLLDGQGADELLAGYHLFFEGYYRDLLKHGRLVRLLKEIAAYKNMHGGYPKPVIANIIGGLLPPALKTALKSGLGMDSRWLSAGFAGSFSSQTRRAPGRFASSLDNHLYECLTETNLPSLLHYEDRNSMAFSIEARVPFLDYRLVEFAFTLPAEQKLKGGLTKVVLRDAMQGVIPEIVRLRADKIGFETPEDKWFRTVAKERVTEIIRSKGFRELPYFKMDEVDKELEAHLKGEKNIGSTIWRWINIHLWLEAFKGSH